jgi:hypothetical protein
VNGNVFGGKVSLPIRAKVLVRPRQNCPKISDDQVPRLGGTEGTRRGNDLIRVDHPSMAARSPLLRLLSLCPRGPVPVQQLRPLAAANRVGPLPWRPLTMRQYATATEAPSTGTDNTTSPSSPAETIIAAVPPAAPASEPPPAAESKPSPPLSPTDHHDESAQMLPKYTHQFDTYRLVLALQSAGYSRPQAIALMKCLRTLLIDGTEFAKSHYLSHGDLENVPPQHHHQTYL